MKILILNGKKSTLILLAVTINLILGILLKLAYPFPDFFSDSYSYISAAQTHQDINIWPIGYSKFLILFHHITHSDLALVTFQYLLLEFCCLYFFLTIIQLTKLNRIYRIILFVFLFCNPLILYISNYISSDAIFCSLTLIWATELIWIIYAPNPYRMILPAVCTFLAFTLRYNAMYYPIITVLVYLMSKERLWVKILGSTLVFPFLFSFYMYSKNAGEKLTGQPIWSVLSGWQWGNNALYMRGHIDVDSSKLPDQASRNIDRISRTYFRAQGPELDEALATNMGCFFIQNQYAPLKQYMFKYYPPGDLKGWAMVSPAFGTYGIYLIRTHPIAYLQYYLWPNTGNYFCPFLEKLIVYNLGENKVWPTGASWFDYKNPEVHCINPMLQGQILFYYPLYFLMINILLLLLIAYTVLSPKFSKADSRDQRLVYLILGFWAANFGFSVLANIIVLRYQLFPMIFFTAATLFLINFHLSKSPSSPPRPTPPSPPPLPVSPTP